MLPADWAALVRAAIGELASNVRHQLTGNRVGFVMGVTERWADIGIESMTIQTYLSCRECAC